MNTLAFISVLLGGISAVVIALDLSHHRQCMRIMNPVWILTGLWAGVLGLIAYFWFGREKSKASKTATLAKVPIKHEIGEKSMHRQEITPGQTHVMENMDMNMGSMSSGTMNNNDMPSMEMKMKMPNRPQWQSITLSTLHCGAGCTLADIIGEWFLYFVVISIGGSILLGSIVIDYLLALAIGVYFQFAAIRSMSSIPRGEAVIRAFKADVLSLTAWQIGMYGFMAIALFILFSAETLPKTSWVFWFMMQIAMLAGFCLSFPANILLIKWGIKKAM